MTSCAVRCAIRRWVLLLAFLPALEAHAQEAAARPRPLPEWEPGDWWIVAANVAVNRSWNPEIPRAERGLVTAGSYYGMGVFTIEWRFEVQEPEAVNAGGDICDVITVRPHRLPRGERDDTGGEPLWTLWIRRDDGSLARGAWKLRDSICGTGGAVRREGEGSRDFRERRPVVWKEQALVPLDVPLLPVSLADLHPLAEYRGRKMLKYIDDWLEMERYQTVEVLEETAFGQRRMLVLVTLWDENYGEQYQLWVPGYPWWVEWHYPPPRGRIDTTWLLRARLVEFGKRGEKGTRVPPLFVREPPPTGPRTPARRAVAPAPVRSSSWPILVAGLAGVLFGFAAAVLLFRRRRA